MSDGLTSRRLPQRDPDVKALISQAGGLFTPRELVKAQARKLLEKFSRFPGSDVLDALKRIKILASIAGFEVQEMDARTAVAEKRDAVLVQTHDKKKGLILCNRSRSLGRIIFSIAHEIAHSFFPVTEGGVRFRTVTSTSQRLSRELEALCDIGAAELIMPEDLFRAQAGVLRFDFDAVELLQSAFGASYEATLYRFIDTRDSACAGGLAKFRRKPTEERDQFGTGKQLTFLGKPADQQSDQPAPRYRVHAFTRSASFPSGAHLPKHKSFPDSSCLYRVTPGTVCRCQEYLPYVRGSWSFGAMQARIAPYQDPLSDSTHPDVLFMFQLVRSASA